MWKPFLRALTVGLFLFIFVLAPSHSGILDALHVSMGPWNSLTGPFNSASDYGVALLRINGATQQPPLGAVESGAFGNFVYLAINDDLGGVGSTSRMVKFPSPSLDELNFNEDGVIGTLDDGLVVDATATSESGADLYLTNDDLATIDSDNPNDHSGDYILGMTVDTGSNDLYAVVRDGGASMAVLRLSQGNTAVQNVIEFAAPDTMPQPLLGVADPFNLIMMGPESVAYHPLADDPDVYFFTDGSPSDFAVAWALQDLPFPRTTTGGGRIINASGTDSNFFTDELRVQDSIIASDRDFDVTNPHIHSDIVVVNAFDTLAFCTGRVLDQSLFIIDDLNDSTEYPYGDPELEFDPDTAQIVTVIDNRTPTALCNVFDVGEFDSARDILMADFDHLANTTQIVKVHFNSKTSVTQTVLNLSTFGSALPGRITSLAMDIDGNIYAVDGAGGCVFLIRGRIDIEVAPPDPSFSCFQVDIGGNFTMSQLVASINAEATNVVTELKLIEDGNLDAFLTDGAADIRNFYYFHQPVTLPTGNHLLVDNGDVLIFRCDGADRAYLDVFGQIRTVADDPASFIGVGDIIQDVVEEGQPKYTSVIGFISWLKSRGVNTYGDLGWNAPMDDAAALGFQAFANRLAPFTAQPIFDVVHSSTTSCLAVSCINSPTYSYQRILEGRIRTINDEIDMNLYGAGVGRWGGLWFGNSEIGNGPDTASSIEYSVVEFAEAGVYDVDDIISTSSPRDEDHLRIVNSYFFGNLIGISIDGPSPLVARNSIRFCAYEAAFDNRVFGGSGGATPFTNPCTINRLTRRFVVGDSGTGVFITKRDPGPISSNPTQTSPLFYSNQISDNAGAGVIVQQPGLEGFPGTSTNSRVPKPLFGSIKIPAKMAHEFTNSGRNSFARNNLPGLRKNFVYRVLELPNDGGVPSIDHPRDVEAQFAYWGEQTTADILATIIDGRGNGSTDYGEVVLDNAVATELTSVEGSTDLYK